jgi:hypothetical protein
VTKLVFDDGEVGGRTTELRVVLDTGSANLQVVSTACPSCHNYTHVQYPGELHGGTFTVSHIYGTLLRRATGGIAVGELFSRAVEFGAIVEVTPRFFQGATRSGDNCYDAWEGLIGLGLPSMARGGVTSPMAQFVDRGAGDGFSFQMCPWIGSPSPPPGMPDHVGHFWLGGWDSHYVAGAPSWEPLATCRDAVRTNMLVECSRSTGAWTATAYGLRLDSIRVGTTIVDLPVDINKMGQNASDAASGWSPHYATIMPEGGALWLNADANADALMSVLDSSSCVAFPAGTSAAARTGFWRGEVAVAGATVSSTCVGITLRFAGGSELQIDRASLFATLAEGLKQVGVDGRRGYRQTVVGLSAFVDNVVMFDHGERRIGFARGRNCAHNPQPGEPGYTAADHTFALRSSPPPPPPAPNIGTSGDGNTRLVLLAFVGGVAVVVLGGTLAVKLGFVSVAKGEGSQALLSDVQPSPPVTPNEQRNPALSDSNSMYDSEEGDEDALD